MNIAAQNTMAGRYNVLLYRDGALHKDCGWSENLILDSGLNYLFSTTANLMGRAEVGTGTTVAAVTQTQLIASLGVGPPTGGGAAAITAVNAGTPTFASKLTYSFTFTQGAIIGNITEVGVGPAGAGALFSRALIVDGGGTPISVAVASIDQVIVLYELTIVPIITDTTGTIVFNGVSTTYVARAYDLNNFGTNISSLVNGIAGPRTRVLEVYSGVVAASSATLSALTGAGMSPLAAAPYNTAATYVAYGVGSFSTTVQLVWNSTVANQNIGSVNINDSTLGNKYQISFSPAIAKTNTQALTINFTIAVVRA